MGILNRVLLNALVLALLSSGAPVVADAANGDRGDMTRYTEAGVATPGSEVHAWISAHSSAARSDTPIAYRFTFGKGTSHRVMEAVHRYDGSAPQKSFITFDPPPPPGYDPPVPGATGATSACGYPINFGSQQGTASMEFTWEYRNTRDSDGDGQKDSDPQWVLVEFSATHIELGTSAPPLEC